MEKDSCYVGIDLNDSYAMVSYYQSGMSEPGTVSMIAGSENFHIPALLARRGSTGMWYYGEEAKKMAQTSEVICVDALPKRAIAAEVIGVGGESYEAVDLLAMFLRKITELPQKLGNAAKADRLVITVERLTKENMEVFWKVAEKLEFSEGNFMVLDHKESFYYFALSQQEQLWRHDVFLYVCERDLVYSCALKRDQSTRPQVVTIQESGRRILKEPKDQSFTDILAKEFESRTVSSVYLVGDGFDSGWMKNSINFICKGRRAFMGQNLFSKGACYAGAAKDRGDRWPFIYLGENVMKFNLSIQVNEAGRSVFFNLVSAGKNWFEEKGSCEVILSGSPAVEFWKQLPDSREAVAETVELTDLPERPDRTTRLFISAKPLSDDKIGIEIKDLGFGEMFRATNRVWKYTVVM